MTTGPPARTGVAATGPASDPAPASASASVSAVDSGSGSVSGSGAAVSGPGGTDGAVLMHREAAALLAASGHDLQWHDLTRGSAALARAGDRDVVYAGCGPYAFLHHAWRERSGGGYRIVREVHTALWSGYWTQEELCAPLVRPGDLALFPTEYTRSLYRRHFPSVRDDTSAVLYPLLDHLPAPAPPRPVPPPGRPLRVGLLGALSLAKNVDQVLAVLARLRDEDITLVYAGKPNHPRWRPAAVAAELARLGARPGAARWAGILGRPQLGAFFAGIDVLLFPSTAARETLGRVVLEALAHGVPVLAARLGPAPELLPARNLVPVRLDTGDGLSMDRVGPLGRVDEDALARKLIARDFAPAAFPAPEPYSTGAFLRALAGELPAGPPGGHDRTVEERLSVAPRTAAELDWALDRAVCAFAAYFTRRDDRRLRSDLADRVPEGPARTALDIIVRAPERLLADYRSFPRLLDALVLRPLSYRFRPAPEPSGTGGPGE
ncbi:hypothetical protein SSCG_01971 [Streptomyces clavuligerus]|nr:hypothetical protein SSCG_01971 [Streptomyces clavuligerus]